MLPHLQQHLMHQVSPRWSPSQSRYKVGTEVATHPHSGAVESVLLDPRSLTQSVLSLSLHSTRNTVELQDQNIIIGEC